MVKYQSIIDIYTPFYNEVANVNIERLNRIEHLLTNPRKKETVQNTITEPRLLTVDQAADFLCLSKATVYKMTSSRNIPCFKVSKRVYFKPQDLEEWVSKYKLKTMQEIEQEADNYLMKKYRKK